MTKKTKKNKSEVYVSEIRRSDDVYLEIPEELGFEPGDEFRFESHAGGLLMTKIKYESVTIDLSEETFAKVAHLAHKKNITFNEMVVELIAVTLDEETVDA